MEKPQFEPQPDDNSAEKAEDHELTSAELIAKLRSILDIDHISFLEDSAKQGDDIEDMVGYAYGALLEQGEDPDEVLAELDIIQPED